MLHEILSSTSFINPQIDYLLFLQHIRQQFGCAGLFMTITKFGEFLIPTLCMCIIYWCIDFKTGLYLLTLNVINLLMSQILKLGACVYRPWILCDKIHPVEEAMLRASGYSFPSGHTAIASVWGGLAYILRNKKLICAMLIILVLLIAFSRNYVGVHTPQDVLVALFIIVITVFGTDKLLKWCEKDKNRYLHTLIITDIAIATATIYVLVKNYPLDYINGEILVNPKKAIYGALINAGWIGGIINGALLCARFFPFETKNISLKIRVSRAIIGIAAFIPLYLLLDAHIYHYKGQNYLLAFISTFLVGFFITGVYPFVFKWLNKKTINQ